MEAPRTSPSRISALLSRGIDILRSRTSGNPHLEAELLLSHLLGLKKTDLYLERDRIVEERVVHEFLNAVEARSRGVPVQYITGTVDFHNVSLIVDGRALIPRPETEVLVQVAIDEIRGGPLLRERKRLELLEIGTGSGAISCALAREFSEVVPLRIIATDISRAALELAAMNVRRYGLETAIELRWGDAFRPVEGEGPFDGIISNPPYVRDADRDTLPEEIRDHEPGVALFSGKTGFEMIETLIGGSGRYLRRSGFLALELGLGQFERVERLLRRSGFTRIFMKEDLTGVKRIALASGRD